MEVSDLFADNMKKTCMEAFEVTFADGLSQACRLLFETLNTFGSIYVFLITLFTGTRASEDFQFPVLEITENAQPQ